MKTSRDLMLLASVAFKNGKYDDAGALFAASLSADDSNAMLQSLNALGDPNAEELDIESVSSSASTMSLSEIVASISSAIGEHQAAVASSEDDSEESEDEEDEEDEEDADEEEDGLDEESISTASSKIVRRRAGEQTLVVKANSPIKLKA